MSDTIIDNAETSTEIPAVEVPGQEPADTPTPDPKDGFKVIDSQEALNRIVEERLARDRKKRPGIPEDYDDLKAKVAEYEQARMTDEEKREAAEKAKAEADGAKDARIAELEALVAVAERDKLRSDVAAAKGVPASLFKFLNADSQEELEVQADELLAAIKPPKVPNDLPTPTGGGKPPVSDPVGFDPVKKAAEVLGGGIPRIL
jgi:hypothetical protein